MQKAGRGTEHTPHLALPTARNLKYKITQLVIGTKIIGGARYCLVSNVPGPTFALIVSIGMKLLLLNYGSLCFLLDSWVSAL